MKAKSNFARKIELTPFGLYQRFEHLIILILTLLIAVVVVAAVWKLVLKIIFGSIFTNGFDPSDYASFQAIFGMIFTVIIALEFKKSLLIVAERNDSAVQMSSVVIIAILAVCRKLIILDLGRTDAMEIVSLAAAILALGVTHWVIVQSAGPRVTRAESGVRLSPSAESLLRKRQADSPTFPLVAGQGRETHQSGDLSSA